MAHSSHRSGRGDSAPSGNPYSSIGVDGPVALFTGHLYEKGDQGEINLSAGRKG